MAGHLADRRSLGGALSAGPPEPAEGGQAEKKDSFFHSRHGIPF
jgi:hypothetical protein